MQNLLELIGGAATGIVVVAVIVTLMKYPNPRVAISEYFAKKIEIQLASYDSK